MRRFFPTCLAVLPGAVLAQAPALAPPLPEAGAGLLQVVLGLAAVIAALLGGLWLLRRIAAPRGGAAGALRVVSAMAVGQRERVVLIEVEDTWLVVGVAPGQVSALHQMPRGKLAATSPAKPARSGQDFGAWMKQILERKHAG
jgi:flagellar protein FliO/FliZ